VGEEYRWAGGDERGTCNCEDAGWIRFARGVSMRVGCVVSDGAAKNGERPPRICVGCVTYVSSSLWELAGGGEEDAIGSRRYIV
jgi:hypothetical protein